MSTIAIFIKLLATNIVANSFLGLSNKFFTILKLPDDSFSDGSSSKSEDVKEKNAISAPDIKAEQTNKINKTRTLIKCPLSNTFAKIKLGGSISKILRIEIKRVHCFH